MKLTINVSEETECTSEPWWTIIDPKQNMSTQKDACHNIASMITGPFFSRESAETHLDLRRHAFGPNAVVFCHSGCWSPEYKEAYGAARSRKTSKPLTDGKERRCTIMGRPKEKNHHRKKG